MGLNPENGRRFGPYEIQSRLGGGGMGAVYKAWDARLHREVAIKILHNEYAMPGMRERFLREARAASALNHPNICTIFDIGEQDGDPYLVMELLEGETLRHRIEQRTMQVDDICCIARDITEGLGAAHAKGVIHRDIKPANIFLINRPNTGVQAKILDFGLAKIEGGVLGARGNRSMDLTSVGSTVGTLAYMSPEQARGEMLDSRSDLFSLGVTMYEMATRHVPFPGATSALVFVKLLNHPPEAVRDWNESIPRDLERVISKLMAKDRVARFQTAQEVVDALNQVSDKGGGGWLRKAVATVPLVRAPDPVARGKKPGGKRRSGSHEIPVPNTPVPAPEPYPKTQSDSPQVLRPIARLPRGETPRPPLGSAARDVADAEALSEGSAAGRTAGPVVQPMAEPGRTPDPLQASSDMPVEESEGFQAAYPALLAADLPPGRRRRPGPGAIAAIAAVVLAILLGLWLLQRHGSFRGAAIAPSDPVVLTEIENRTGDKSLDGTVADAFQIELAQSPYLALQSTAAYRTVRHLRLGDGLDGMNAGLAHELARQLGARAYLYGSIAGQTAPYVLHVELRETGNNSLLGSAEERAASLAEVPSAVDRLASDLRSAAGESSDSISRTSNPLSREATTNLDALHSFSQGETALAGGHSLDALKLFQQAAAQDPHFALAQMHLTTQLRKDRAEVGAASAAKLALAASDTVSDRLRALAQFEYEMNASGDYNRAAGIVRHLLSTSPHDPEALEALARTLRQQGHMAESLQAAQDASAADPYSADAVTQAEHALIGLDRYDAAYQLQTQADRIGLSNTGNQLIAAYLEARQDGVSRAIAAFEAHRAGYRPQWTYGVYLDNLGQLSAGSALWRRSAATAANMKGLESTAGTLLAQGALDMALVGDCGNGLSLAGDSEAQPRGINALFNAGMAFALCGNETAAHRLADTLARDFPQSFAVTGFYLADLNAAIALHENDPARALEALKPARQYDLISLTPYLRGKAHVALRQTQIGIVDFQTVLAHRGMTFLVGNSVYPMAEIGVARAFADTGDLGNSAEAYRRFLDLWRNADPNQPLLLEAKAHVK